MAKRETRRSLWPDEDYSGLSIRDLLEAREQYHVHLMNLENVVATCIGRYRIRRRDPDSKTSQKSGPRGEFRRTLSNTVVQPWSWPCVLVFVKKWLPLSAFARSPEQMVPPRLYLPDGRKVPVCVVEAAPRPRPAARPPDLRFVTGVIGGGFPLLHDAQGTTRYGTAGCLVADRESTYVLTNRHVMGEKGQQIFTYLGGERRLVGHAARGLSQKPLVDAYPGFAGKRSQLNLDVGLIKIADVRDFTAQVLGIGELDELVDLHPGNLSLELAGLPVMAHGGASGPMRGEILGFFFRYRSLGGIDHVADLAIGPRDGGELDTRPGDSGTLWFLDLPDEELERRTPRDARAWRRRPIAMQWGGGAFSGATESNGWPVALATSLSTALRELEVDLVRDWANGISEYWGKVGHYKVGAAACTLMRDAKLARLMKANVERIGVSDERIKNGLLPGESTTAFVALADVPDLVWRATRKKDAANHFADMDEKGFGAFDGKTLMDLWDDGLRTPKDWTRFYDEKEVATGESIADKHRGALPFRVKELYLAMVKAVKAKRLAEFICAAGVLAHYVGDACQPLHVSYLHHGRPGHDEDKVHSIYESTMLDRFAEKVIVGVNAKLGTTKATATVQGGDEAASVVVALMKRTIKKLPPIEVIEAFNAEDGKDRLPHMWTTLGARTIDCLADGSKTLAKLWESAWKEGGGSAIAQDKLVAQTEKSLLDLYLDKKFLEPNWLKDL